MQTGTVENRITTSAHGLAPLLSDSTGQIVFENQFLGPWSRAFSGGLTQCYSVAACLNADGDIVRARTLSTGKLDVAYATPADTLSFTTLAGAAYNGSVVPDANAGGSVAIVSSGNNVDVAYVNGYVIKRIRSTDKGHTFPSAAETIVTLTTNTIPQVAMPVADLVFYTDIVTNLAGATISYKIYSGSWGSANIWDLFVQKMGTDDTIALPDGSTYFSSLAAISVDTNDYLLIFFAKELRGDAEYGLWTMRVRNVGSGLTPQWCNPQRLRTSAPSVNAISSVASMPSIFYFAPRIQTVGSETWITALECSNYANNPLFHLAYFRSTDFVNWTDREYLGGTDTDWTHLVGATPTNWTVKDLLFGQVLVSSNRTFVLGYDKVYLSASTSLVGVTNAARRYDASVFAQHDSMDLPEGGETVDYRLELLDDEVGAVSAQIGSTIRERGEITVKAGYKTSSSAVGEEVQIAKFIVDPINQEFTRNKATRRIELSGKDYTKKLSRWKSNLWIEYVSGRRFIGTSFEDSSAFKQLHGNYILANGALGSDILDPNYSTVLDNVWIIPYLVTDGELLVQLKCSGASWTGAYAGIVFGVLADEKNYHAIIYNKTASKFSLSKSIPTTSGRVIHQYQADLAASGTIALSVNTNYWLYVKQVHNRILAWYSTDKSTWTNVIDYTGTSTNPIFTSASYWGIVSKGAINPGVQIGNTNYTSGRIVELYQSDHISRDDVASRITTPAGGGYLRSVRILTGLLGSQNVPDLSIGLIQSKDSDGSPADIVTDPTKIVWSTLVTYSQFAASGSGVPRWYTAGVAGSYALTGNRKYYAWLHPNAAAPAAGVGWGISSIFDENLWLNTYQNQVSNNSGQTWLSDIRWGRDVLALQVGIDSSMSGVSFSQVLFATDDLPKTFERIATDLATRAGIVSHVYTSVVTDSFSAALDKGADGSNFMWANNENGTWVTSGGVLTGYNTGASTRTYLRSNSYRGTIGDLLLRGKLKILAASKYAGYLLRGSGSPTGSTFTGYVIYFGTGTGAGGLDEVIFTKDVNNTVVLTERRSFPYKLNVGQFFAVEILSMAGTYQVFVNDMLAGTFYDASIIVPGFVGHFCIGNIAGPSAVANWDDTVVSDLGVLRDSFVVRPGVDARSAIRELVGENERILMQMRYDGALWLSRGRLRSSVDTYTGTFERLDKQSSDDWFSVIESSNQNILAARYAGSLLESGVVTEFLGFPDAVSDQQAYEQSAETLRLGQERRVQWRGDHAPVFTAEREDVNTLVNSDTGDTNVAVLKSMHWERDFAAKLATGSAVWHQFVS